MEVTYCILLMFKIGERSSFAKLSFIFSAMAAILPYLTIQMKDIGISLSEIAIIYAVLPFTAFLGPPIMGIMADQLGQYKGVLIVATIINGLFHTLLLAVPKYSETPIYAPAVIEFRGVSGAILRPESLALCDNFDISVLSASNRLRNQMINVYSCNAANDSNVIASRTPWNLPSLCHVTNNELLEQDENVNPIFTCGNANAFHRTKRSLFENSGKNKCALKVRINSEAPNLETFTCKTNYTFESGDKLVEGNNSLTFWLYFAIRIVGNVFMNACFSLLDATTLAVVGNNEGSEYGKERILCTIGAAVVSPLAGLLVDRVSAAKGYTDYSSAFYFSNALLVINIIGYFFMKLTVEKPEEGFWKNATDLLNYPEVVVFLGMIFVLGNLWGFVESYLFIFLDELNAPKYLLGLTLTVGSLAGIPFLYGAEKLVTKAGRVNIIAFAFIVYFIRFFGYSYIPNPFWCFPFEAMEAFTYHLMWVAAATYCAVLAPKGLLATLTGVMGSLHYGLGKGSGAFIGGYLISVTNTRLSFRYFGIAAGIFGTIYLLINKFWLEGAIKRRNERGILYCYTKTRMYTKKLIIESVFDLPMILIENDINGDDENPARTIPSILQEQKQAMLPSNNAA
ncbi:Major facilitator superfamily domain-containing protein 6 [Orchesella cincta]|uniref:Major facilitator superfamily domain-containing protein 6 n=1 Tax=Orchesella cincta TaxID=48709 RepID=A0A1D2MZL3_ORCCI|nr:Major facilitator superfamily domain-containing protein 6 [Orchesella cincta]